MDMAVTFIKQHLIDPEICIRCNTCEETCPVKAISNDGNNYVVDAAICKYCMACVPPCPTGAIDNWRVVRVDQAYSTAQQLEWMDLPGLDGLPDVTVDPSCVTLIEQMEGYEWDKGGEKERPVKTNDHGPDALRYGVRHLKAPPALVFDASGLERAEASARRRTDVTVGTMTHTHPAGREQDLSIAMRKVGEIEFDAGDHHKQHHRPPGDAVQRLDDRRREDEGVVIGKEAAEDAGAEQDAGDDLDDDERRVIVGLPHAPDQPGHGEDDRHRDQEDFGGVHAAGAGLRARYSRKMP